MHSEFLRHQVKTCHDARVPQPFRMEWLESALAFDWLIQNPPREWWAPVLRRVPLVSLLPVLRARPGATNPPHSFRPYRDIRSPIQNARSGHASPGLGHPPGARTLGGQAPSGTRRVSLSERRISHRWRRLPNGRGSALRARFGVALFGAGAWHPATSPTEGERYGAAGLRCLAWLRSRDGAAVRGVDRAESAMIPIAVARMRSECLM